MVYEESGAALLRNDTLRISVSRLDDPMNHTDSNHASLTQDILLRDMETLPIISSIAPMNGSRYIETNVTASLLHVGLFSSCHHLILCRVMWGENLIEFPPSYIEPHCKEAICQIPPNIANAEQHYVILGLSDGIHSSNLFHFFYHTKLPALSTVGSSFRFVQHNESSSKTDHIDVVIERIVPNSGPVSGGTSVLLTGINFVDDLRIKCKFGNQDSIGQFISSREIACMSPPRLFPGSVAVVLEMDHGILRVSTVVTFTYYVAPRILRFNPHLGPVIGGINLTVIVDGGLGPTDHLTCRFDHSEVHGRFLNETAMICTLPPYQAGLEKVHLAISKNDGHDFSEEALQRFQYVSSPRIISVAPSYGKIGTKTVLSIKGKGFQLSEHFSIRPECILNTTILAIPSYVSRTEMHCEIPAMKKEAKIPIQVRIGKEGNSVTSNTMIFNVIRGNMIESINPDASSPLGGTEITLHLERYVETKIHFCKFGDIIVNATHKEIERTSCISPPSCKRHVPLFVSFDRDHFHDTGFTIRYNQEREPRFENIDDMYEQFISVNATQKSLPVIKNMHQCHGSNSNASCVSIHGENFSLLDRLDCQIGKRPANLRWISTFHVECHANFSLTDTSSITLRNRDRDIATADFRFQTQKDFEVRVVHYNAYLHSIMVIGQNFVENGNWTCSMNDALVEAEWIDIGELNCKILPNLLTRKINLQVCNNGIACSGNLVITLSKRYQFALVNNLPLQGDLDGGEFIHFESLHSVGSTAKCRFGSVETYVTKTSNASSFYCIVPRVTHPQEVAIELSLDGEEFIHTEVKYRYLTRPTISNIQPSRISIRQYSGALRVHGSGFVNIPTPICLFDGVKHGNAILVSFTEVWCMIPKNLQPGKIKVSIAYEENNLKADSNVYLVIDEAPRVFSMYPSSGPPGTKIDVCVSTSFLANDTVACHFGRDKEFATLTNFFLRKLFHPFEETWISRIATYFFK
jgi:IPT/TIG domain.